MKYSSHFRNTRWLSKLNGRVRIFKTLPEAQWTQGGDSIIWVDLSAKIFQNWFQGTTCIGCKFGYQMAPLEFDYKFGHHLHQSQTWPLRGGTSINWRLVHQAAPLALALSLIIRWWHLHLFQSCLPGWVTCIATLPWIALLALSVSIGLVSSSARVTSVKSAKHQSVRVRDNWAHRSNPRYTWIQ